MLCPAGPGRALPLAGPDAFGDAMEERPFMMQGIADGAGRVITLDGDGEGRRVP